MGIFQIRKLVTTAEFSEFASGYMESFRHKKLNPLQEITVEKLQSYQHIMGVYRGTQMIAGYLINTYPHRCFEYLSPEEQEKIISSVGGTQKVCEIVAIWKHKSVSRLTFAIKIWSAIIFDTLKERRSIIFGCSYAGHGMIKRYSVLNPKVVRHGKNDNDLTIFYFYRWQFLMTYIVGMLIGVPRECYRKIMRSSITRKRVVNE